METLVREHRPAQQARRVRLLIVPACVRVCVHRNGDRIYNQIRCLGASVDWTRQAFTMDEVCTPFPSSLSPLFVLLSVFWCARAEPECGRERGVRSVARVGSDLPRVASGQLVVSVAHSHLQH